MDRERVRGAITTLCFNSMGPNWTGVKSFSFFGALISYLVDISVSIVAFMEASDQADTIVSVSLRAEDFVSRGS